MSPSRSAVLENRIAVGHEPPTEDMSQYLNTFVFEQSRHEMASRSSARRTWGPCSD